MSRKPFMKRACFVADPMAVMCSVLPAGNELVSLTITENGMLLCEFVGVDVPKEHADTKPMLILMEHTDARGQRDQWFEPQHRRQSDDELFARDRRGDAEPA